MTANVRPADQVSSPQARADPFPRGDRLESWKEIAAYLSRSERTVRRWEDSEGLPVHRLQHDKRGSVYAYASELDGWREARRLVFASEAAVPTFAEPSFSRRHVWLWLAAVSGMTAAIVAAVVLPTHGRSGAPGGTDNPAARRALSQGHFAANAGRVQIQTGIHYFEEAIRLDPRFAQAWEALASAHMAQTWFADAPASRSMAMAKQEAERALQLAPSLAGPWRVLGNVTHFLEWNHPAAERYFQRAIAIDPRSGAAHSWYAEFLLNLGRFDEALAAARRAEEASPRWLETMMVAGNVHAFSGHHDLAIAEYRRALALEPGYGLANHFHARALLAKGQHAAAVQQLRKSNAILGEVPFSVAGLGYALAIAGERDEARRMLADCLRTRDEGYFPAFAIAEIHAGLGNVDAALEWLERASGERHVGYYLPSVDPTYDRIRSQPRFIALLKRMNLR
jgi:serine/threonine-protein kinase